MDKNLPLKNAITNDHNGYSINFNALSSQNISDLLAWMTDKPYVLQPTMSGTEIMYCTLLLNGQSIARVDMLDYGISVDFFKNVEDLLAVVYYCLCIEAFTGASDDDFIEDSDIAAGLKELSLTEVKNHIYQNYCLSNSLPTIDDILSLKSMPALDEIELC